MKLEFTEHALFEMSRRSITNRQVEEAVNNPQQELRSLKDRVIIQNRYYDDIVEKEMILRVIGNRGSDSFEVITVYKTSKVEKYWMED